MFTLTDANGNSFSGRETLVIENDRVYIDGHLTECLSTGKIEARGNIPSASITSSVMIILLDGCVMNLAGGINDSDIELIEPRSYRLPFSDQMWQSQSKTGV